MFATSYNFSSSPPRPSPGTTRLRLVVPGLGLGGLEWSLCWPPRTTSVQVHRGQVQVQLGFASLNLDLALVDLRGVSGGLPRATSSSGSSGQVQVQLGFASFESSERTSVLHCMYSIPTFRGRHWCSEYQCNPTKKYAKKEDIRPLNPIHSKRTF